MQFRALKRILSQSVISAITMLTAVAVAQAPAANACTAIVREALTAANQACSGTSRNQICYGNVLGMATPADGVDDLKFDQIGDIADLTKIRALQLSPLDEAANEWGVALMQLQATLPDSLPGQNVTFLLFGDVTVEENTGGQGHVDARAAERANVRLGPNATGPILGSLPAGAEIVATGKTVNSAEEQWVRLRYEAYRTRTGWVLASLLDVDLDALPGVAVDSMTYSPMQAFYFRTGIGRTQCASAPLNGLVVQTPRGVGTVSFNVNGIEIALGSTAYINAPEQISDTCVSLINGDAELRSNGETLNLDPGEKSCTAYRPDGAAERPGPAQPFDPEEIAAIVDILDALPEDVVIPDPAPRRTATPRGPTPTATQAAPTDTPEGPAGPLPTLAPTLSPSNTPDISRFVNISHVRGGFSVQWTAAAGPDAPLSYAWNLGDGTPASGPNPFHVYAAGNYTADVVVCWPDGDCLNTSAGINIPPCAVDYSLGASTQVTFAGGPTEQYEIFKNDEFCGQINVGLVSAASPVLAGTGHVGEQWTARLLGGGPTINLFFITDQSAYAATVP